MMRKLSLILINMQIWPLLTEQAKHWAAIDYLAHAIGLAKAETDSGCFFCFII